VPMSSRFTKKSLVSVPGASGEDAVLGPSEVGVEHAHAADEHRHFRRGERQQLRLVDQQLLGRSRMPLRRSCGSRQLRFQHGEGGLDVGLLLRGIGAAGVKGTVHVVARPSSRRFFHGGTAAQHDQVSQRNLLAAGLGRLLNSAGCFSSVAAPWPVGRLVDFPVLLRSQANARPVGAAALVAAAEGGGGAQAVETSWETRGRRPGSSPSVRRCPGVDQRVVTAEPGPARATLWDLRAEVARARAHVAVGQLEPGLGEGIGELVGVLEEAPEIFS
jgi:hypothetical protein